MFHAFKMGLILFALFLTGCSTSTNAPLNPYRISNPVMVPGNPNFRSGLGAAGVSIRPLVDGRSEQALGEFGGSTVKAAYDVAAPVRQALEDRISSAGVNVALLNAPSIGGEIKEWFVSVVSGFPTDRADARAALELNVFDSLGQIRYRGTYKGTSTYQRPFLSKERVEETLGEAMGAALDAALEDDRLISALQDAQSPVR